MECRDARPLIASLDVLPRSDRERLDVHLHACAACRDEVDDPLVAQSLGLALPLAMPPHSLVQEVLLRLPAASPVEIAAREQRARRVVRGIMIATFGLLGALGLAGFILLQFTALRAADLVRGVALPLALAAKALLAAAGQPWIALVLLAATLVIPALLPRLLGGERVDEPFDAWD